MTVDVLTEIEIERPLFEVADYAADPVNAPHWYVNIKSIEWVTTPPMQLGSRIRFVAQFLGRRLEYTYEVIEYVPSERLVLSTAEGPFPMHTAYTWRELGPARTHMTMRNSGVPSGFSKLMAPMIAAAMRRANNKDLALLKTLLERPRR